MLRILEQDKILPQAVFVQNIAYYNIFFRVNAHIVTESEWPVIIRAV
jgi:hypothetical protein